MAYVLADNIISPLGQTSEENYLSVKTGKSAIRTYSSGELGIPEEFAASLLLGDFEELAFMSAQRALEKSKVDVKHEKVVFILSSTKGNVEDMTPLADSAEKIASRLGIMTPPFVVCNACISGLSALTLASRLLDMGMYDDAVVCGCDAPKRFIVSGFLSLKALSHEPCRPFDMERFGLNLGEAAATMVLGKEKTSRSSWRIYHGFIKNDAFHISAPSKTAEGLLYALKETLEGVDMDDLALVNAHGTATLFNDQMESVAIERAGLSAIPANALKGYFGHTLGAAGILETILSMKTLDDHVVLGTRGFEELGVSGKVNISSEHRKTDKHSFVKMLSGFGGCNATICASSQDELVPSVIQQKEPIRFNCRKTHLVRITPNGVSVDGNDLSVEKSEDGASLLSAIYKQYIGNYPKFYKMDKLCKLGFVASELLLQAEKKILGNKSMVASKQTDVATVASKQTDKSMVSSVELSRQERAVVLFNHSSSVDADKKYMATISDKDNYFPSPSVFVYTLPNIVTGEIAIRNGYQGETSFYILPKRDDKQMEEVLQTTFCDSQTQSILTGWIDYEDTSHFEAELWIVERDR